MVPPAAAQHIGTRHWHHEKEMNGKVKTGEVVWPGGESTHAVSRVTHSGAPHFLSGDLGVPGRPTLAREFCSANCCRPWGGEVIVWPAPA